VLPMVAKVCAAGFVTALPVFFSGMVFSRSLQATSNVGQALGINLLGAVVGGALENIVMLDGTRIVAPVAVMLYAVSAVALISSQSHDRLQKANF